MGRKSSPMSSKQAASAASSRADIGIGLATASSCFGPDDRMQEASERASVGLAATQHKQPDGANQIRVDSFTLKERAHTKHWLTMSVPSSLGAPASRFRLARTAMRTAISIAKERRPCDSLAACLLASLSVCLSVYHALVRSLARSFVCRWRAETCPYAAPH